MMKIRFVVAHMLFIMDDKGTSSQHNHKLLFHRKALKKTFLHYVIFRNTI